MPLDDALDAYYARDYYGPGTDYFSPNDEYDPDWDPEWEGWVKESEREV